MMENQISSTSRKILDTSLLFWVWNVRNLDKKNRRAKYGAQFQSITVEIKERIEHGIPPVWLPDQTTSRSSFHKLHQRTQVTKRLSSVKLPKSSFSL